MKNLFKYEINESIAAKAAMNCVHKRLFKELYAFGAPMPQEEVTRGDYDPYEWEYDDYGNEEKRHLIHQALVQAGLIQSEQEGWQFNNKIQQLLDKTNFPVSDAKSAAEFVKAYGQQIVGGTQEQEEHPEDADRLQSQLANAWDEGMADDEDDYVPYENKFDETHRDIVDNLISAVEYYFDTDDDVNGFYHYNYTEDQLGKAVENVLDKYGDFPSSNNFDKCYAWTKKHAEELMKILETGSLDNSYEGHPEFDFSEQEEDYSDDSHGIEMIIDLMVAKHMISDEPKIRQIAWKLIERKLNEEGMFIGDDDHEAERFVSFFGEDLVEEIAYWRW